MKRRNFIKNSLLLYAVTCFDNVFTLMAKEKERMYEVLCWKTRKGKVGDKTVDIAFKSDWKTIPFRKVKLYSIMRKFNNASNKYDYYRVSKKTDMAIYFEQMNNCWKLRSKLGKLKKIGGRTNE